MTESNDQDRKKEVLHLQPSKGKLELKKTVDAGSVRQSFSHGRSKTVTVEVKRKRTIEKGAAPGIADGGAAARRAAEGLPTKGAAGRGTRGGGAVRQLTKEEREVRARALRSLLAADEARRLTVAEEELLAVEDYDESADLEFGDLNVEPPPEPTDPESLRQREIEEMRRIQVQEQAAAADAERLRQEEEAKKREVDLTKRKPDDKKSEEAVRKPRVGVAPAPAVEAVKAPPVVAKPGTDEEEEDRRARKAGAKTAVVAKPVASPRKSADRRRSGKITVTQALNVDEAERTRSMAALRRARERERQRLSARQETVKVTREVVLPEVITVQELANRMAERGADVIKSLMRMGVMATITQTIDADTAELVITEFGHRLRRVSDSDVEVGLMGEVDREEDMRPRPPVVTIMGHVDHGKTSLLDALRHTDVVSSEAGGITQHIGAYQVVLTNGGRITFIDTPGHAAFTEMRARGANVTDVVVLVVAANDGIMPQTVEAIQHAKAAKVPMIVAINKIDLPDARPERVRQELLQHGLVVEELGGDLLAVEVSAKAKRGLERLEEAILLQAEILELRANPNRPAVGAVIEAKLERGRGSVATVLVQRGTLRVGDVFVAGCEWGRVRALVNERGQSVNDAGPSVPVEVIGLNGTPMAGDEFTVLENEARAREIAEFRQRKKREAQVTATARGTLEQMFSRIQEGEAKELPIVLKGDVQGSIEAIVGALEKLCADNTEVKVRVLSSGVGAINESDVTLANASKALVIGFNVRANPQARDMARRDGIEIRYYSVIYNVIDDVRAALVGLLSPTLRERFLGNAAILEVFNITKVGKVAGCRVTEGIVKRGAGVRLLRDNVVIHTGSLKTLKRFKDEVKDVREGYECGMAFENYDNMLAGDIIEAFEIEEVARVL
ncbi:MAG: translation initiation factor IF-2 [Rhodospirillaceae bacterium]